MGELDGIRPQCMVHLQFSIVFVGQRIDGYWLNCSWHRGFYTVASRRRRRVRPVEVDRLAPAGPTIIYQVNEIKMSKSEWGVLRVNIKERFAVVNGFTDVLAVNASGT